MIETLHLDLADTICLVTGDTDLVPAVKTAKHLFPDRRIWFLFPYKRRNNELARLADGYCYINKQRYTAHQFPNPLVLAPGRVIKRPPEWSPGARPD